MNKLLYIIIILPSFLFAQAELNKISSAKLWWLGQSSFGTLTNIEYDKLKFYDNLSTFAVSDLIKNSEECSVIHRASYNMYGMRIPTIESSFSIDQWGKEYTALNNGYYFIKCAENKKIIIQVTPTYNYSTYINIIFSDSDLSLGMKTQSLLTQYEKEKNIYRSSVIEITKRGYEGFVFQYLTNVSDFQYSWDDFILAPELKNETSFLTQNFLLQLANHKHQHKKGVLLYGPPGTGKSFLGQVLITETLYGNLKNKNTFYTVSARHFSSLNSLKRLFRSADTLSPSVVFFEDVDLMGVADRDGTHNDEASSILNEFLNQLDGLRPLDKVLTIATTNKATNLDPALIRSGRLGTHLYFGLPKLEERKMFFNRFLMKSVILGSDIDLEELLSLSEGLSGADIIEFISVAKQEALLNDSWSDDKLLVNKSAFEMAYSLIKRPVRGAETLNKILIFNKDLL